MIQNKQTPKSAVAVCTVWEGDYHKGLATLVNSPARTGFQGNVWPDIEAFFRYTAHLKLLRPCHRHLRLRPHRTGRPTFLVSRIEGSEQLSLEQIVAATEIAAAGSAAPAIVVSTLSPVSHPE